ncbi:MAG: hypothetical protein FJW26_10915, partial [Acidimicrobiia bacterium]|nr:hypothetical protein [Acidimicrobiia bacterium]
MRIPFVGGHRPGKSLDQSPQTLINFYIEPPQQEGDPAHLFGMPGYAELTALVTPHAAQVRGLYWLGDGAYRDEVVVVLGNRVYTYNVQTNVWTDR